MSRISRDLHACGTFIGTAGGASVSANYSQRAIGGVARSDTGIYLVTLSEPIGRAIGYAQASILTADDGPNDLVARAFIASDSTTVQVVCTSDGAHADATFQLLIWRVD